MVNKAIIEKYGRRMLAGNSPNWKPSMNKQYTDKFLENNAWIINKIQEENIRQVNKWGIQTHSAFEWLTYTVEELGSLAKAISEHEYRKGPKERVISEAIQVATLALKIAEMFEDEIELGLEVEEGK